MVGTIKLPLSELSDFLIDILVACFGLMATFAEP